MFLLLWLIACVANAGLKRPRESNKKQYLATSLLAHSLNAVVTSSRVSNLRVNMELVPADKKVRSDEFLDRFLANEGKRKKVATENRKREETEDGKARKSVLALHNATEPKKNATVSDTIVTDGSVDGPRNEVGSKEQFRKAEERKPRKRRASSILQILSTWGFKTKLWSKINKKTKEKLTRFARERKQVEAQNMIAAIRHSIEFLDWPESKENQVEKDEQEEKQKRQQRQQQEVQERRAPAEPYIDVVLLESVAITLAFWGCDLELWNELGKTAKERLAWYAKEGKEKEARKLIAEIGVSLESERNDTILSRLATWGCDAELWRKVKPKAQLAQLAVDGDEERAREVIAIIQEAVAIQDEVDNAILDTLEGKEQKAGELIRIIGETVRRQTVRRHTCLEPELNAWNTLPSDRGSFGPF